MPAERKYTSFTIAPMAKEHQEQAAALVIQSLHLTPEDLASFGRETPQECFAVSLSPRNQTHDALTADTLNKPDSLHYYVALDTAQRIIGVSGLYQALPGYSTKIGADTACPGLENEHTFWLGWFGVAQGFRAQAVGTALLRESVQEAVHRAGSHVEDCQFAVYGDAGALDFYKKLGFEQQATVHGKHAILSVPLHQLAVTLQVLGMVPPVGGASASPPR